MDFAQARDMIRLRHDLRRLLAEGRRAEARPLLDRLRQLAERDTSESADLRPELTRWEVQLSS